MAFSLNKIMLIGNLGKDAEHRFTTNSTEVSSFSLATTHSYKGKNDNWVEETTWHRIVLFKPSDYLRERLKKGAKVYVEGRIVTREYEKDGEKRSVTEVVADKNSIIYLSDQTYVPEPTIDETTDDSGDLPF